ncbi:MAG: glucose-6-phosphate isomerase, partial [Clostridia bacterium]|nr:glucose-6-phosphate isomerase [Clostridia bacterium]MBR2734867.1 glucose-6-phosphate isomerase [Clostridia bacterium]
MLSVDFSFADKFVDIGQIESVYDEVFRAHKKLHEYGLSEPIGWMNLPEEYDESIIDEIISEAQKIRKKCDIFVVIGIGGSYLGARAAIEFLHSNNYNLLANTPKIFFIGNSISSDELSEIMQLCHNKRVCINVISKSGTTTEPAIAFRFFKEFLERTYGKDEARTR